MKMLTKISVIGLAFVGAYHIFTLVCDGAKLQRFKRKYYGRRVA